MPNLPRRGGRILENGKIGVPVHSTCLEDGPYGWPAAGRTVPHMAQGSLPDPQTATVDVELRDKKPFVGVGPTGPFRSERSVPRRMEFGPDDADELGGPSPSLGDPPPAYLLRWGRAERGWADRTPHPPEGAGARRSVGRALTVSKPDGLN